MTFQREENDIKIKDPNPENPEKSTTPTATTSTAAADNTTTEKGACAACKYQRRKCTPHCPLAPYFPPNRRKDFLNAHKHFGIKKMMKNYNTVNPNDRDIAMKNMIIESNLRAADPVGGCHRLIRTLEQQIQLCSDELTYVRNQLGLFIALYSDINSTTTAAANSTAGMLPEFVTPAQSMQFQTGNGDEFYTDLYQAPLGDMDADFGRILIGDESMLIDESKPTSADQSMASNKNESRRPLSNKILPSSSIQVHEELQMMPHNQRAKQEDQNPDS